jgi:hypothetical protein
MQVATGKVVNGKVVVEGLSLPDGTGISAEELFERLRKYG